MSSVKIWSHRCGKMSYVSRKDALAQNEKREEATNSQWRGITYLCQSCQYWHRATKRTNAEKRERAQARQKAAAAHATREKQERQREIVLEKKYQEANREKWKKAYVEAAEVRRQIAHMDQLEGVATPKKKRKKRKRSSAAPITEVTWSSNGSDAPVTQRIQLPQAFLEQVSS